jgi:hypothetical protein
MYRGKSRKKIISQDNRCLRPYRTEYRPLLLELNDSVSATESYRPETQSSAHWGSQHVSKDFEIVTTCYTYTLLIATDANATPYAACYVQAPCACVPTFQATPSTTALGLSGSKQGGVYFKDRFDLVHDILGISSPRRSNPCTDSKNNCTTTTVDAHLGRLQTHQLFVGIGSGSGRGVFHTYRHYRCRLSI